jgi:Fe-S oxidoreductase
MATYKAEFFHHYYKGRVRPRQAYALGLIPLWARVAAHAPDLINGLTHLPILSRALKSIGGIAPDRDAPRFAERTFTDWFAQHQARHPTGDPVLVWPDTFTNFFEPDIGIAAVHVLESAGFRPFVPGRILCCGRPFYDYGMLTLARRYLRDVLDELRPQIHAGVPVIGLEPSCLAVFRDELPNLYPDDLDAHRLRRQSFVLSEFLVKRASAWQPPQLRRKALVQPHCHHHSVIGFGDERELLSRMGLDVEIPDAGCCGMAGSFGYEAGDRYTVSVDAGERVLLPRVRESDPETLVVADGFSCRGQIRHGCQRRALHLAEVIELAFEFGEGGPPLEWFAERQTGRRAWRRSSPAIAGVAMASGALGAAVARRVGIWP